MRTRLVLFEKDSFEGDITGSLGLVTTDEGTIISSYDSRSKTITR